MPHHRTEEGRITDHTPDDEFIREQLAGMSALYDQVLDSDVTLSAIDFMARAKLVMDIAGDDLAAAGAVVHAPAGREAAKREYDQLSDEARADLHQLVGQHWSLNVNLAVRKLWHAANVLGFKPDTLNPQMVAMVAATYLSREPDDLYAELARAAGGDPPMDTDDDRE
jgi:hypothetical protein